MGRIKLSYKDLNRWANTQDPVKVHREMQKIWDTDIECPELIISLERKSMYSPFDGRIYLNASDVRRSVDSLTKYGLCKTSEEALAGIYAEEDTHHITCRLVPENSDYIIILAESVQQSSGELLVKGFNIGSQVEGIGKIGRSEVLSKFGSEYSIDKENRTTEMMRQELEPTLIEIARSLRYLPFSVTDTKTFLKKYPNLEKAFILLSSQIPSSAGFKVARIFQERFAGRLPELIRQRLEPDPSLNPTILEAIDLFAAREFYNRIGLHLK